MFFRHEVLGIIGSRQAKFYTVEHGTLAWVGERCEI